MYDRRQSRADRRHSRRAPFVAAVRHHVGEDVELALAQNLGPTGIQLKRPAGPSYSPETTVSLAFALPDGGELVRVRGAVVNDCSAGDFRRCGVRFESLSANDHERILRALDALT